MLALRGWPDARGEVVAPHVQAGGPSRFHHAWDVLYSDGYVYVASLLDELAVGPAFEDAERWRCRPGVFGPSFLPSPVPTSARPAQFRHRYTSRRRDARTTPKGRTHRDRTFVDPLTLLPELATLGFNVRSALRSAVFIGRIAAGPRGLPGVALKERYSREIISSFPYPIAKVFIKLRTDECLDAGPLKLKYTLSTAEAVARFLGVVTLCECRASQEALHTSLPRPLLDDFRARFSRPSWGFWLQLIRDGQRYLRGRGAATVLRELGDYYVAPSGLTDAGAAIERLLTIRNGLNHEKIQAMLPSEFQAITDETTPLLDTVLEALEFLLGYELVFFSRIEVQKPRCRDAVFLHQFKRISGVSDDFLGGRESRANFFDSNTISLLDTSRSTTLALDPMYVYEEEAGKAADVFFYNGMASPHRAEYAACSRGGTFSSSTCRGATRIADELQNVLRLFAADTEVAHA